MSPSGIDFSEAVTASGPSFRICSRSWPKRARDSCMAVAILFRSAATSALNAPPLEAEGEARLTMLGVRAGRRVNRSARIGRSRRSQSCRSTIRGQSHAVRRWSYLAATRCSGFLNLANLVDGSRVRSHPDRWAAGACDDPDRHSARLRHVDRRYGIAAGNRARRHRRRGASSRPQGGLTARRSSRS